MVNPLDPAATVLYDQMLTDARKKVQLLVGHCREWQPQGGETQTVASISQFLQQRYPDAGQQHLLLLAAVKLLAEETESRTC